MKNNLDLNKQLHFSLLTKAFRRSYDSTSWLQNDIPALKNGFRKYYYVFRKFHDNIPDIKTIRIFGFGGPAVAGF
jgi:hypothetical protein